MKIEKSLLQTFIGIFFIYATGCNNKPIQTNIHDQINTEQFEIAKYELYKVNSYLNCDCMAIKIIENEGETQDTFPVLSLDLNLDTIEHQSDTVIYYFDYVKIYEKERKLFVLSSPYNGCVHYYAIAFKDDHAHQKQPIYLLINEKAFMVYDENKRQEINAGFKKCIEKNKNVFNLWLTTFLMEER